MAYTYEDVLREMQRTGAKLSEHDLATAQAHPEFGLSLLKLGQDWNNAKTPEARALVNEMANTLRKSYGGYSGGADGTARIEVGNAGAQSSFGGGAAYKNPYEEREKELVEAMMNRQQFSWNPETDPNAAAYRKQYLREGERATADTLARSAAATGGRPSSWALTAATQAGDYYATQLADKLPELRRQALDEHLMEEDLILARLNALSGRNQAAYNQYTQQEELAMRREQLAREQALREQALAQEQVNAILSAGGVPGGELTEASGYRDEYVEALNKLYREQQQKAAPAAGTGSGGGGYDNGSLTTEQVMALQNALGVAADGMYGPNTRTAAGGLTADEAYWTIVGAAEMPVHNVPTGDRKALDYDEDEGVFTWAGKRYSGLAELADALDAAKLTEEERRTLERKLGQHGIKITFG